MTFMDFDCKSHCAFVFVFELSIKSCALNLNCVSAASRPSGLRPNARPHRSTPTLATTLTRPQYIKFRCTNGLIDNGTRLTIFRQNISPNNKWVSFLGIRLEQ